MISPTVNRHKMSLTVVVWLNFSVVTIHGRISPILYNFSVVTIHGRISPILYCFSLFNHESFFTSKWETRDRDTPCSGGMGLRQYLVALYLACGCAVWRTGRVV